MKKVTLILSILINSICYSQNSTETKEIYGVVSYEGQPLPNVTISIIETTTKVITDSKGRYALQVKEGDKLAYSYVGFKTVIIVVEDVTKVLNVKMREKENLLDEIQLKAKKREKEEEVANAFGKIDAKKRGHSMSHVSGDDLNPGFINIIDALRGKITNFNVENGKVILRTQASITKRYYAIWEVDGIIVGVDPPQIDIAQIKDVFVLKSLMATVKYGSQAAGGVIIITTKKAGLSLEEKKNVADKYTNKEVYDNNAIAVKEDNLSVNIYTNTLQAFKDKVKAFDYYKSTIKKETDFDLHLSVSRDFINFYNSEEYALQILKELSNKSNKNPELLKAIAYQLQKMNAKEEAIIIYQKVFKLRPTYAQSYRDLANAYKENKQYQKAWRLYMSYLLRNDVSGEGIGNIIYNEMEWLYFNKKEEALIKVKFMPKNKDINAFRNDIRMIFEWNTSEAEFELEFVVGPKGKVYTFKHNLEENQDLITDEKEKGYSSKEFIIDDLGDEKWMVNMTYQGNKKESPTYLKITTYYDWGRPTQINKINIFRLKNKRFKMQLLKFR